MTSDLLPLYFPERMQRRGLALQDTDLETGLHIVAGSGSGKSIVVGKVLCFLGFLRGLPQIVIDPHAALVDSFLIQLACLPPEIQRRLAPRLILVDMAATGERVAPFPLLYALPGDSLKTQADRFPAMIRSVDPQLQSASIQGFNRLARVAVPTGMVLAALGRQLTSAPDLLTSPHDWEHRFTDALDRSGEVLPAVEFFRREYLPLTFRERQELASTYLAKLAPFVYDPQLSRMFLAADRGLDLEEVVARRQTVLVDFGGETSPDRRHVKMRWLFDYVMAFVKWRGAGKHVPLRIVIDEITELTNRTALGMDLFANDIDEAVAVYQRNYRAPLVLMHQEMHQVSEKLGSTLLTMGTQCIGVTANMETAKRLAEQFADLDVCRVKRWRNVWGSGGGGSVVLEQEPIDMALDEQIYLAARRFMRLPPFHFLVKRRDDPQLHHVNAARYVAGVWPNEYPHVLASLRRSLAVRSGTPMADPKPLPRNGSRPDTLVVDINENQNTVLEPDMEWAAFRD